MARRTSGKGVLPLKSTGNLHEFPLTAKRGLALGKGVDILTVSKISPAWW